jgi:hypothetical protein
MPMVTVFVAAANAPPGSTATLILLVTTAALTLVAAALIRTVRALANVAFAAVRALVSALRALMIVILALLLVLAMAAGGADRDAPSTGPPADISRAVG